MPRWIYNVEPELTPPGEQRVAELLSSLGEDFTIRWGFYYTEGGSGLNGAKFRAFWDAALAGQIVVFPRDPWVAPQPRARGLSPVGA